MNIDELKNKYLNNSDFHKLVDVLTIFMYQNKVTPQDVRDACFIAGLKLHKMMEETGNLNYQIHNDKFINPPPRRTI